MGLASLADRASRSGGATARARMLGIPLDTLTMDATVERCRELIEARRPCQHVVVNAGKFVLMQDDPRLADIVSRCAVINADGMSVVWAGRWLGLDVPERVAGIDLMERLLTLAEARGWSVFFLGARPAQLERCVGAVRARFPGLAIAGQRDGYFDDDGAVAEAIARSGARLLFVGISSPRKEYFLAEQLQRMGPVFAMGVGGAFDIWAGATRRAPRWMQRSGLEWVYRLGLEPRRMWKRYLVGNLRFGWLVTRTRVRGGRS